MPICNLKELKAKLSPRHRILGLDQGTKTIGVAISDGLLMTASPVETIMRKKFTIDAEKLAKIVKDRQVGALVIGLPINMDGSEGPRCESVRHFGDNILRKTDLFDENLYIAFHDERLSSAVVNRMFIKEVDMTRKRRAELVDKMAATYILQGALDLL